MDIRLCGWHQLLFIQERSMWVGLRQLCSYRHISFPQRNIHNQLACPHIAILTIAWVYLLITQLLAAFNNLVTTSVIDRIVCGVEIDAYLSYLSHIIDFSLMWTKVRLYNLILLNAALCHTVQKYILLATTFRSAIQHAIVAIRATNGIAVVERIVGWEFFRQEAVIGIRIKMLVVVIMLVGQIDIGVQMIILTKMRVPRP